MRMCYGGHSVVSELLLGSMCIVVHRKCCYVRVWPLLYIPAQKGDLLMGKGFPSVGRMLRQKTSLPKLTLLLSVPEL